MKDLQIPSEPIRIFVSYAHADNHWVRTDKDTESKFALIPWLVDSLKRQNVVFWIDQQKLEPGDIFKRQIAEEIDKAQIAILVVSQAFLNSDFIDKNELPRIKTRVDSGKLLVVPLLVEPCAWEENDFLSQRQMLPGKPTPLIDYTESAAAWAKVRNEIREGIMKLIKKIRESPVETIREVSDIEAQDDALLSSTGKFVVRLDPKLQPPIRWRFWFYIPVAILSAIATIKGLHDGDPHWGFGLGYFLWAAIHILIFWIRNKARKSAAGVASKINRFLEYYLILPSAQGWVEKMLACFCYITSSFSALCLMLLFAADREFNFNSNGDWAGAVLVWSAIPAGVYWAIKAFFIKKRGHLMSEVFRRTKYIVLSAAVMMLVGVGLIVSQQLKPQTEDVLTLNRKLADQGLAYGQFNLGNYYANGIGVVKDEAEAVKWYRKAVDQGYASAQNNLAICYQNGTGVEKDEVEAVSLFRKAADQGEIHAIGNLGFCYENGIGVAKDETEAVSWYRKAADLGDAFAQYNLARCYENGVGVAKDVAQAVNWYRKAGTKESTEALNRLKTSAN